MCILYEVTLDRFLPELWPFVSFSNFINRSSCLRNSSYSFLKDFDETLKLLFPWPEDDHILSRSCSADFYQSYGPLTIFQL